MLWVHGTQGKNSYLSKLLKVRRINDGLNIAPRGLFKHLRSQIPSGASQVWGLSFWPVPHLHLVAWMELGASRAGSCRSFRQQLLCGKGRPTMVTSPFPREPPKSAFLREISQLKNVTSSIEILLAQQNKSVRPAWVTGLPFKNFLTHSRPSINDYLLCTSPY